jgi:DNA-binding cell septation regulator SpoVG
MDITDIRVKKVMGEGKLKAYVSVTFDDCFVVHNMKVIDGKNGVFVAMPSRKTTRASSRMSPIHQHDFGQPAAGRAGRL